CASGEVFVDKWRDNALFELALEIDDIVGHADVIGHAADVIEVVERAAAPGCSFARAFRQPPLIPELHGQARDVVAVTLEQCGDGGTVDPSGHCYCNELRHASR